ncbi:MAG: hypothetical protein R3F11_22625 [Verrucomicrobiales bacterium]
MKHSTILLIAAFAAASAPAQVLGPNGGGGNNNGDTTIVRKEEKKSGSFLGTDIPFMNPGDEVAMWDGKSWNVTDNRVFNARFEKYLNAPEAVEGEDLEYRKILDSILQALSPHNPGGPNVPRAVALLPLAAQYPIDARLCDSLANAVYGNWMAKKHVKALSASIEEMRKERKDLERNFEVGSEGAATAQPPQRTGGGGGNNGGGGGGRNGQQAQNKAAESSVASATRVGGYVKDIVEIEAKMKMNQGLIGVSEVQQKIEYQSLIIQFFLQRRFEHVVIATRLYRSIFNDGDTRLHMEKGSDVEKIFAQGIGVNPTIATLDAFANEAIRDVTEGVKSFHYLLEKGELESASKRLSESFMVGEYLHAVRAVPREDKRKVVGFVRMGNQLISALEVKDYTLAEELITKMRAEASDFDYSKPKAAVDTARAVSNMHLSKARIAALNSDETTVADEMRKAAELWPTNPALSDLNGLITQKGDVQAQAILDLDRLISTEDYAAIFKDQGRFIAAVVGQPEREKQLKSILEDQAKIQGVVMQAEELARRGDKWGAWESVQMLAEKYPQDKNLNRLRSDLSIEISEFVRALTTANRHEQRNQTGSSLAWYLRARKIYPSSTYAKQGIDRLTDEILPSDGAPVFGREGDDNPFNTSAIPTERPPARMAPPRAPRSGSPRESL